MGIEDQSIQAYQTIGQPPSAPQLNPAYQQYQQQGMLGQAQQVPMPAQKPPPEVMQKYQEFLKQQQQGPTAMTGFMGGLAPAISRQMDMPQPAISRPFDFNTKPQQDTPKPQFGMYASSLHQIADNLQRASGESGKSQIGKFGGGLGQFSGQIGKPGAALNQLGGGLFGGMNTFGGGQQAPAQMSSVYTPTQQQAMTSPLQALAGMQVPKAMRTGGATNNEDESEEETEHKEPEDLTGIARHLASKGRGGDSVLIHINPQELKGIKSALKEKGYDISYNPHTGLPEALFGGLKKAFKKVKNAVGPVFTKIRDVAQSAAVLVANKYIPGSSMFTAGLTSKGSQKLLNSGIGKALQMATSGGGNIGLSALKTGLKSSLANFAKQGIGATLKAGAKNLGSNIMSGIRSIAGKGSNLLSNIRGGISNLISNPSQTLKNWGGKAMDYLREKGGDLKEAIGNKISDMLSPQEGGAEGEEGGSGGSGGSLLDRLSGMLTDPDRRTQLISGISALYGAKHQEQDPREKAGLTDLPKIQQQNYELKQVPNPNYGKPGEPFYLSQEFTPAQPAQPQPASPPTQAAGGGLMSVGYAAGGMPSYAPGGNVEEYQAGGKLLDGPGDGMSDSIPAEIRGKKVQKALLADGEFVIPADVVSGLGNGSTKAGAKVLYGMMDRVRQARTGTTEQGKQINPNKVIPA